MNVLNILRQKRTRYILLGIGVAMLSVGLVSKLTSVPLPAPLSPTPAPLATPTPQPLPIMPAPLPPENQPPQDEFSFHLSSNAIPGDTDMYAAHSFALSLEANQRLSLGFKAVGAKVLVSIYTPALETWGYSPSSAASPEMGVIGKGRTIASEEGSATFTAVQAGNYVITVKSASPKTEIDITLDYGIEAIPPKMPSLDGSVV